MTKKDFEAIARTIKDARDAMVMPGHPLPAQVTGIFDSVARDLAKVCATTNPRFNRSKFLSACGVADLN